MKSRRHGTSIRPRSNSEKQAVRKIDDTTSRQLTSMRSSGAILTCFAFLPFLAGCQTQDNLYLRQGAGLELFSSSLPEATQLQDAYIGYICDQAGLGPSVPGPLGCDSVSFGPAQWTIFVQGGMNDID